MSLSVTHVCAGQGQFSISMANCHGLHWCELGHTLVLGCNPAPRECANTPAQLAQPEVSSMSAHTQYLAKTRDGRTVHPGDTVTTFRGEPTIFRGITRIPEGSSTGKVCTDLGEHYPSVVGLTLTPAPSGSQDHSGDSGRAGTVPLIGWANMGYAVLAAVPASGRAAGDWYVAATDLSGHAVTWSCQRSITADGFVFSAGHFFDSAFADLNTERALASMVKRAGVRDYGDESR